MTLSDTIIRALSTSYLVPRYIGWLPILDQGLCNSSFRSALEKKRLLSWTFFARCQLQDYTPPLQANIMIPNPKNTLRRIRIKRGAILTCKRKTNFTKWVALLTDRWASGGKGLTQRGRAGALKERDKERSNHVNKLDISNQLRFSFQILFIDMCRLGVSGCSVWNVSTIIIII